MAPCGFPGRLTSVDCPYLRGPLPVVQMLDRYARLTVLYVYASLGLPRGHRQPCPAVHCW